MADVSKIGQYNIKDQTARNETANLTSDMSALNEDVTKAKSDIEGLQSTVDTLVTSNSEQQTIIDDLNSRLCVDIVTTGSDYSATPIKEKALDIYVQNKIQGENEGDSDNPFNWYGNFSYDSSRTKSDSMFRHYLDRCIEHKEITNDTEHHTFVIGSYNVGRFDEFTTHALGLQHANITTGRKRAMLDSGAHYIALQGVEHSDRIPWTDLYMTHGFFLWGEEENIGKLLIEDTGMPGISRGLIGLPASYMYDRQGRKVTLDSAYDGVVYDTNGAIKSGYTAVSLTRTVSGVGKTLRVFNTELHKPKNTSDTEGMSILKAQCTQLETAVLESSITYKLVLGALNSNIKSNLAEYFPRLAEAGFTVCYGSNETLFIISPNITFVSAQLGTNPAWASDSVYSIKIQLN